MTNTSSICIEICANSIQSALAAEAGGADRIELCSHLETGGTTPSHGLIKLAQQKLSIPICVLVRPRPGNHVYDDDEYAIMLQEIRTCKELGVPGVTLGVLKQGHRVDVERTRALVEAAKPMDVTFSRAFDEVHDLTQALEDVVTSGCTRLLTSGGARNVELGQEMLTNLVAVANSRIAIMPGGGVRRQNIVGIVKATGVNMVHSSAMDHGLNIRRESDEATDNMFGSPPRVTSTKIVQLLVRLLQENFP